MLADSTGKEVAVSDTVEASALGAAIIAAYGAGWFSSFNDAAQAMSGATNVVTPDPKVRPLWDELLGIYRRLFPNNEQTFNDLVQFAVTSSKETGK